MLSVGFNTSWCVRAAELVLERWNLRPPPLVSLVFYVYHRWLPSLIWSCSCFLSKMWTLVSSNKFLSPWDKKILWFLTWWFAFLSWVISLWSCWLVSPAVIIPTWAHVWEIYPWNELISNSVGFEMCLEKPLNVHLGWGSSPKYQTVSHCSYFIKVWDQLRVQWPWADLSSRLTLKMEIKSLKQKNLYKTCRNVFMQLFVSDVNKRLEVRTAV